MFQVAFVVYLKLIKLLLFWVRWSEICLKPILYDAFLCLVLPTKDPCHPIADSFLKGWFCHAVGELVCVHSWFHFSFNSNLQILVINVMFVFRPAVVLEAETVHIKIVGQRLQTWQSIDYICSRKECILALLLQEALPKHLCSCVGRLLRVFSTSYPTST